MPCGRAALRCYDRVSIVVRGKYADVESRSGGTISLGSRRIGKHDRAWALHICLLTSLGARTVNRRYEDHRSFHVRVETASITGLYEYLEGI